MRRCVHHLSKGENELFKYIYIHIYLDLHVFIYIGSIEIKFTYCTVYPFKVDNSVGFSIFRVVQTSLQSKFFFYYINFRRFSLPHKETPYPLAITCHPPSFLALGNHQSIICHYRLAYCGDFI